MTLSAIQQAVLEILDYYLERQALAADLLDENLSAYGRVGDWQYSIHGDAITLTHTRTGEPIDWEPPDLDRFDRSAFAVYMGWLMRYDPDNVYVERIRQYLEFTEMTLQAFVYQTLEQFHHAGLLSTRYYNSYTRL